MMFDPLVKKLNIADGQVAAAVAAIFTGVNNQARKTVWKFCNVGTQEETLILTFSRNGGTQRRIKRVVLAVNYEFKLSGLPIDLGDVLYAVTTDAASVDYTASYTGENTPYSEETFDDTGRIQTAPYIIEQLDAITS